MLLLYIPENNSANTRSLNPALI